MSQWSGYVHREHVCELPRPQASGDLWLCECGRLWEATVWPNHRYDSWHAVGKRRTRRILAQATIRRG